MGAYRYLPDQTTHVGKGIIKTATEGIIPPVVGNPDWDAFLVWLAVPNTPDPSTATPIGSYRKTSKAKVDLAADVQFAMDLRLQASESAASAIGLALTIAEAVHIVRDGGTFSAARHPMLNELIGVEGATGADVATAISTWWDGVKVRVGKTSKERWKAHKDINAAANVAAVDAVAPSWPAGPGAGE